MPPTLNTPPSTNGAPTPAAFKALPPLLDAADLKWLGWSDKYIASVRYEVKDAKMRVPFGRVGWIRNPPVPKTNGQPKSTDKPNRKGQWRREDVARILGAEWMTAETRKL